ncbi:MAG: 50S ribosomal protein L15 [Thaumarchaeota archaeon]|nr:50S ribosomal protein L15 [Candidatus Calditenuaceae archaeon]
MPTRFRKIRKLRGSRTVGWGQIGQHRKHGAKGGRGRAGMHKHKWTYTIKYDPEHFGEKGFFPPTRKEVKVATLTELSAIAERLSRDKGAPRTEDGKLLVDLKGMGYDKLIGSGIVSVRDLKVVVERWTESAARKLSGAGSVVSGV